MIIYDALHYFGFQSYTRLWNDTYLKLNNLYCIIYMDYDNDQTRKDREVCKRINMLQHLWQQIPSLFVMAM
jgi:hypothetical protein